MQDITIIHKNKVVGTISNLVLTKYSEYVELSLINVPKMDNKIITKINFEDIFNDIYKKEPYFYNDKIEINWKQVLKIINCPKFTLGFTVISDIKSVMYCRLYILQYFFNIL